MTMNNGLRLDGFSGMVSTAVGSSGGNDGRTPKGEPYCKIMTVTPQIAAEWLRLNTRNRRLRKGHVARLVRDMAAGRWGFNPQPISFGPSNAILDGQHRLTAVVESGVTVRMVVWFDVPESSRDVMDQGVPRNLEDVAEIPMKESAVTTAMMRGLGLDASGSRYPTVLERKIFHRRYAETIRWVLGMSSMKVGVKRAAVTACMARASLGHMERAAIAAFASVLDTGIPMKPEDVTVIRLRDKLMSQSVGTGNNVATEVYGSTAAALLAYRDGRAITKIYPVKSEPFPLPVTEDAE